MHSPGVDPGRGVGLEREQLQQRAHSQAYLTTYYDMKNPYGSVLLPKTGTKIRIDGVSSSGRYLQVTVSPSKSPAK